MNCTSSTRNCFARYLQLIVSFLSLVVGSEPNTSNRIALQGTPTLRFTPSGIIAFSPLGMVAFTPSGNALWAVPGDSPQIATADNGVIGTSDTAYDSDGNATALFCSLPTYSWKGAYQLGSVESLLPAFDLANVAQSAAVRGGNLTGNGFSLVHHTFGIVSCNTVQEVGDGTSRAPLLIVKITELGRGSLRHRGP